MKQNVEIIRGNSDAFSVSIVDALNNPYTLESGEVLVFGVKKRANHDDCIIKKTATESSNGEYFFKFVPADTEELSCGKYFYDIGLYHEDASGVIGSDAFYTVVEMSEFIVKPNITKWSDAE